MHALTGAGVTMAGQTREERRDAEFAAYMQARQPSLLRTAYLLTGDRHTAEDLVQTALAKLYLSWDKVQSRDSVDGYVRRILVNENISRWRRHRGREVVAEIVGHDHAATVEPVAERVDLAAALARLTAKQRTVLVLRYYDDLTERQTAELMGVALGTVKSQTRDALAALRRVAPHLAAAPEGRVSVG